MTIKEIADFTARTTRTVRGWVKKASETNSSILEKISNATEKKVASDFTLNEVEIILYCSSMSRDAISILMDNARKTSTCDIITPPIETQSSDVMQMFQLMMKQQQEFMTAVIAEIRSPTQTHNSDLKMLSLPETPGIEPRAYLNQLVREYAQLNKVDFRTAWNILYTEILYRCHENIKVKAKNEGIKSVDYLERENKLLTACSIMKGLIDG